jgi:hypothetical protein
MSEYFKWSHNPHQEKRQIETKSDMENTKYRIKIKNTFGEMFKKL